MTKPFEPADGTSPRWQKLYDLVLTRAVGDEITYREALEVLSLARDDVKTAQAAMRAAVDRLERAGERTLSTVARFGWIVVDAHRELQQVDRRLIKARRAAGRTARGVDALNGRRGELSQFERERLDRIGSAARFAAQATGRRGLNMDDLRRAIEGERSA